MKRWVFAWLTVVPACGGASSDEVPDAGSEDAAGPSYTVEVALRGSGTGAVTSTPPGIECPGACVGSFAAGTEIMLTPAEDDGGRFGGWSGACAGIGTCRLQVDADRTATATFTTGVVATVELIGSGSGTVVANAIGLDCGDECGPLDFAPGTSVTFEAIPDDGSVFGGWLGPCFGIGSPDPETGLPVPEPCGRAWTRDVHVVAMFVPPACAGGIECPIPEGGKVSVCGWLLDNETGAIIQEADADGSLCSGAPTETGPCSMQVQFYDPLAVTGNPTGTAPLDTDQIDIDDCGRFRGVNVTRPFNGFMSVATYDAEGVSSATYALTATSFPIEAGEVRYNHRAIATRHQTVQAWTASAGDPFGGQTFADVGVVEFEFVDGKTPVRSVKVTAAGATDETKDYYFVGSDTAHQRTAIDPDRDATSANGVGLIVDSGLGEHSGTGGEPDGCQWSSGLAAAVPGVVSVLERDLKESASPTLPCQP